MKKTTPITTLFMVLFGILILNVSLINSQEIETKEDIPVVYNPKKPIPQPGAKTSFILEEELCIGCGAEINVFSPLPRYIYTAVDKDLNIYTLDHEKAEIRKYSSAGQLLKVVDKNVSSVAMISPHSLMISPQNELVINDATNGTLTFYSLGGEFLRHIYKYSLGIRKFMFDSKGNIVADLLDLSKSFEKDRKVTHEIRSFNQKLEPLSTIFSIDITEDMKNRFKGYRNIGVNYLWQQTKDDYIIVGDTRKYEFVVLNPEGKIIKKIRKEFVPLPVSKEDLIYLPKVHREWKGIAKQHTGFYYFTIDYQGRIFARTWERTEDKKGYYYDVFDPEGRYIAKVPINASIKQWMKGKMLAAEETEDGSILIKQYKVTWK